MPVMTSLRNLDRWVMRDNRVLTEAQWRRQAAGWRWTAAAGLLAGVVAVLMAGYYASFLAVGLAVPVAIQAFRAAFVAGQLKAEDDRLRGRTGQVLRRRPASLAPAAPAGEERTADAYANGAQGAKRHGHAEGP